MANAPADIIPLTPEKKSELIKKIQTDPLYQQAFLQEKCRQSFRYFCREVMGYKDMNAEHDALCDYLQFDPAPNRLILMPRGTFKSFIGTMAHTLWLLANDPNMSILIYSDSTEKAEGFLTDIKNHMQGSIQGSLFRGVFGKWEVDPKRGVWNQSAATVAIRKSASRESSIETAGLETSKTGKHYQHIKMDDLVTDKNVTTRELMLKVIDVYKNADPLLLRSGRKDIIGTRWDYGDLYGWLLSTYKGDPNFSIFHRSAHNADCTKYFFTDIGKESLTPDICQRKKKEWGSYKYSCLIQNEPVDPETATFKVSDFSFYNRQQLPAGLFITCCLDPIPPHEGTRGDDAALTVCGTDHELNIYILDIVRGRMQPSEQIEELFRLHQKWHINAFGVETNAFQKVMRRDIEFRYKEERLRNPNFRFFHIEEFVGASLPNKELRIRGLQPYHERGALKFPGESVETLTGVWSELAFQLIQFPKSAKDDLSDSLAGHVAIHRPGSKYEQKAEYPPTSAAWFEREQRTKQLKVMQRMPRWQRRPIPELSFS